MEAASAQKQGSATPSKPVVQTESKGEIVPAGGSSSLNGKELPCDENNTKKGETADTLPLNNEKSSERGLNDGKNLIKNRGLDKDEQSE